MNDYADVMSRPVAYFLTWHTYGSWLHGDTRGSVDRNHNIYKQPILGKDEPRRRGESKHLRFSPVTLDERQRGVVEKAVREICEFRGWEMYAVAVRSNHVHVVLGAGDWTHSPEIMLSQLKSRATRRLREEFLVSEDASLWVRHGSTRYLWNTKSVLAASQYVMEGQDVQR